MSLQAQSELTEDRYLIGRVAAAAAVLGEYGGRDWAARQMWQLSARPEWATRYGAALEAEQAAALGDPAGWASSAVGRDPSVITDQMILVGVCRVLGLPIPQAVEPDEGPPATEPSPSPAE